ncbi:MAG: isopentenyl phosphate kinase family protein [Candidatus Bathyarchaeota archaeon]|nr:MAG: isopentenyl phosphate kinase family protein [Candidatus Bathyarchaeota archaeon]
MPEELQMKFKDDTKGKTIVLKLGGSVITNKKKLMVPKLKVINRLAKEIADANIEQLIVVHGGGGFGHPWAKQYKIKEGYKYPSQVEWFTRIHQAMLELNKLVVDALIRNNIAAFSVSPSSCIITKAGRIQVFYDSAIVRLLEIGFVPVLFGDAVVDNELGFTILSGDQLVTALSAKFNASRVIFGVDVDGLFTADPKTSKRAQLIRNITLPELKALIQSIEQAKATDVTGGMFGKIFELMVAIDVPIKTIIVNATKEGNIYKALREERVIGTVIEKE